MCIRYFILICFFIHTTSSLYAQSAYEAIVLDSESKGPINDVHVLLVNSSFGTFTGKDGRFAIPEEIAKGSELIYSHVNYDVNTSMISLNYKSVDTIYLKPSENKLESVTIKSKKTNLKELRLKIFLDDLFELEGKSDVRKIVEFKNSDEVLFLSEDAKLSASANNLLRFENKYLGYKISCLLQQYERSTYDLNFTGKAIFQELDTSKKKKKKQLKRREKVWNLSQQKFFQDLISNQLLFSKFTFLTLNMENFDLGFLPIVDFEDMIFPTVIDGVFALKAPASIIIKADKNVSRITSSTGIILLNRNGLILNKEEVNITGYWAQKSLAQALPVDYREIPDIPIDLLQKQKASISDLKAEMKQIMNGQGIVPIEEIQLEIDRFLYNFYDEVYVSAYLHDHRNDTLYKEEILIYFDLFDPEGNIVFSRTKKSKNGVCHTSFFINKELGPGQYAIRAYSDYMKNFDEDTWAKKVFAVELIEAKRNEDQLINLNFFVEGGKLIPNSENRIIALVTDKFNNPIAFSDSIIDNSNNQVYSIKTLIDGIAIVNLEPTSDSKFELTNTSNRTIDSNLSSLEPESGISLSVLTRNTDHFRINFRSFDTDGPFNLAIYDKGIEVYEMEINDVSSTYSISKDFLPKTTLSVQLKDAFQNTLSERLIDNSEVGEALISFEKEFQFFYANQPSQIKIIPKVDNEINIDSLLWNVKIINKEYTRPLMSQNELERPNLISKWDLSKLSSTNKRLIRNHLLLANKTANSYQKAYSISPDRITIPNTNSTSLSGRLLDAEYPYEPIPGKVSLSKLSDDFFYEEIDSDNSGNFKFPAIPFETNLEYIIQARKNLDEEGEMYDGNRMVKIVLDTIDNNKLDPQTKFHYFDDLITPDTLMYQKDSLASSFKSDVLLNEVTIKQRRSIARRLGNTKDLEELDYIPKSSSGQNLLSRLYPSKLIRKPLNSPNDLEIRSFYRGKAVYLPLVIFINGDQQFNTGLFYSLTADQIKYINLNNNALSIITTPNNVPRSDRDKYKYGLNQFILPQAIDFVNIDKINQARLKYRERKTSYWYPGYRISSSSPNYINFTSSNLPGTYTISMSTVHPKYGWISYNMDFEVSAKEE